MKRVLQVAFVWVLCGCNDLMNFEPGMVADSAVTSDATLDAPTSASEVDGAGDVWTTPIYADASSATSIWEQATGPNLAPKLGLHGDVRWLPEKRRYLVKYDFSTDDQIADFLPVDIVNVKPTVTAIGGAMNFSTTASTFGIARWKLEAHLHDLEFKAMIIAGDHVNCYFDTTLEDTAWDMPVGWGAVLNVGSNAYDGQRTVTFNNRDYWDVANELPFRHYKNQFYAWKIHRHASGYDWTMSDPKTGETSTLAFSLAQTDSGLSEFLPPKPSYLAFGAYARRTNNMDGVVMYDDIVFEVDLPEMGPVPPP